MTPRAAFAAQSAACDRLGSPFTARLMALAGDRLGPGSPVADRILDWPGDPAPSADSVPLRLAGALHALVLDGHAPALAAVYPPHAATDEDLWNAVAEALASHAGHVLAWLASAPQTNEVRRSAALIPALHLLAGHWDMPLALSEIGASAGLNLLADRFALDAGAERYGPPMAGVRLSPDWAGPPPPPAPPEVVDRAGVDLHPLDPGDPAARRRLRAYLWADQPARRVLTDAALAEAAAHPVPVAEADAADWLRPRLARAPPGTGRVVFHTIAWQYLAPGSRARARAAIEAAGACATPETPLAWLSMEADGRPDGAGLALRLWPGGCCHPLGRADFHGRWVQWAAPRLTGDAERHDSE